MKKFILFLCAVIWVLGAVGFSDAVPFNGHDYILVTYPNYSGLSWEAANSDVKTRLGDNYHLATITSQGEQDFIESLMVSGWEFWIGGYQSASETDPGANWQWVNGEGTFWDNGPTGMYTNWDSNEPNDTYGVGAEQHLGIWASGVWNDEGHLGNITGYIAESTPVPEPATIYLVGTALFGMFAFSRKKLIKK